MSESPRGPRLRIVAVNDVYLLDNLPRLRSLVESARSEDPADCLLVTMAGDFVAPSMLSSLDAGRGMVDCMNAVGFTHVIFGNHEDDIETEQLSARVRELHAPCIGTNLRGFDPELPLVDVVEFTAASGRRLRLGIVGVVMHDATVYQRVPFGGAALGHANDSARHHAARLLAEQRCDGVLALTHQPIAEDRLLAASVAPPLVMIAGGHEHQVFLEQDHGCWIVKAGADAVHAAIIDCEWAAEAEAGEVERPRVDVRLVDLADYPEDPELSARAAMHMRQVDALQSATLMLLPPGRALSSVGTRSRQTSMGTLIASHIRDTLHAEACIFNGGGIRGAREYRERLSFGDLETEVPFANEVVVVPLPGSVLQDAIVASRARAPEESGGFLQVCDALQVDADTNQLRSVAGLAFDPQRLYRVALVRNFFTGMDDLRVLVNHARNNPAYIPPSGSGRDVKLVLLESFAMALWNEIGGFDTIARNADGSVCFDDLKRAIEGYLGQGRGEAAAGLVMRTLDTDHDHGISADEARRASKPPA